MRRRRSKMRALKKFRIQGQIFVYWMLVFSSYILCEPGYLDFDNLPDTNFTCAGKVIGGYYADLETSCQMFHVCTIGQLEEPMDIKFLCLNGTVFDQETRVCERVEEVDCSKSVQFYHLNLDLYMNPMVPQHEEESSQETYSQPSRSTSAPQTTISTTTAKTVVSKPASTIPSLTDDKLKKQMNSYPQSRPSLAPPIGFNLSTTQKPFESDDVDDEYEYEDEFYTTHGKDLSNYQSMFTDDESSAQNDENDELVISDVPNTSTSSQKLTTIASTAKPMATTKTTSAADHNDFSQNIFSPQQFILSQSHAKQSAQSLVKLEPISFQQQQFQNGGTLTVTNSHPSSTTTPSPSSDLSYLQSFRVQGQGFRLPSVHLANNYEPQQHILQQQQHELLQKQLTPTPQSFEGYRKQQKPQVALRLPIEENRPHFDSLDAIYSPEEQKGLKQSESHPQSRRTTQHVIAQSQESNYGYKNDAANSEPLANNTKDSNKKITTYNAYQTQQMQQNHRSDYSHQNYRHYNEPDNQRIPANRGESSINYDKVLLTPQEQYIPTLPKVIITASASVTDASGKKLNYSVGNVISSTNAKLSPIYDEYREDDVSLDPFFLDVPKILPRRNRRHIVVVS